MSRDTAISRSVLSDQIKDRLLQAILAGRYPPGSRVVETRVARELGTSQAPVREALRDLEAIGVIEIEAFRGARVRRPSADELLEALAVRCELESLGVRLAVPRLQENDITDLQGCLEEISLAANRNDAHGQAVADARFHAHIIGLAASRMLVRTWRYLEPFSRTYISLGVPGADLQHIAEMHYPVQEALSRRDPAAAVAAIQYHFAEAGRMLKTLWVEAPPLIREPVTGPRRAAESGLGPGSPLDPIHPAHTE